jgi:hypothetical protein
MGAWTPGVAPVLGEAARRLLAEQDGRRFAAEALLRTDGDAEAAADLVRCGWRRAARRTRGCSTRSSPPRWPPRRPGAPAAARRAAGPPRAAVRERRAQLERSEHLLERRRIFRTETARVLARARQLPSGAA